MGHTARVVRRGTATQIEWTAPAGTYWDAATSCYVLPDGSCMVPPSGKVEEPKAHAEGCALSALPPDDPRVDHDACAFLESCFSDHASRIAAVAAKKGK